MPKRFRFLFLPFFMAAIAFSSIAAESKQSTTLSPDVSALLAEQNRHLLHIGEKLQSIAANLEEDDIKKQMEIDDLHAQQDMAMWAQWMFIITAAGTALALVSILFLRSTLRQNSNAIDISHATLDHSKKTSQLQLRAYVGVTVQDWHESFFKNRTQPSIHIHIRNYGSTPALSLGIAMGYKFEDISTSEDYEYVHGEASPSRSQILMPNNTAIHSHIFLPLRFKSIELLHQRLAKLHVNAEVSYKDIFGSEYKTTMRFVLFVSKHGEMTGYLSDYGNIAT